MSILLMMALCGGKQFTPQVTTVTFTSSTTYQMPAGVTNLTSASGKGAAGSPGSPGEEGYSVVTETILYRKDGTQEVTRDTSTGLGPPPGASGCDPYEPINGSDTYNGQIVCRTYSTITTGATPPRTGASASITAQNFSRVFPGGAGGPATTTTFNDVPVTPLQNYTITVPAGGSITLTYLK